ncbi:MAG: ABC transporter ATP-binding protein [Cyanobacteria bacterium REEB459]|nr:ABC transporter ATP-binding protein [Cyanobacteria bacterium REEB459]
MGQVLLTPLSPSSPGSDWAVQTTDLGKVYRSGFWLNQRVMALQPCSLRVGTGETFGLLGPNGAGKTTLLKILLGIIRPSCGSGTVLGHAIGDRAIKHRLGYLPEQPNFYDFLTGWEFLRYAAGLCGLDPARQPGRMRELFDLVGLSQAQMQKKQLRQYSKGMLQRIGIAQALINDPDLVFLDEPMGGLDPIGRFQVREIILALKQQGKTIFFNSHILADVEVICDRIAILNQGELVCIGRLEDLLGSADRYVARGQGGTADDLKAWLEPLRLEGDRWQGTLKGDPYSFVQHLATQGVQLTSLQQARPTLEAFFIEQIDPPGYLDRS